MMHPRFTFVYVLFGPSVASMGVHAVGVAHKNAVPGGPDHAAMHLFTSGAGVMFVGVPLAFVIIVPPSTHLGVQYVLLCPVESFTEMQSGAFAGHSAGVEHF